MDQTRTHNRATLLAAWRRRSGHSLSLDGCEVVRDRARGCRQSHVKYPRPYVTGGELSAGASSEQNSGAHCSALYELQEVFIFASILLKSHAERSISPTNCIH